MVLAINTPSISVPAECDVDRQFVDFSLVSQTLALVRFVAQPLLVGDYCVFEAFTTPLQSDKRLWHVCGVVRGRYCLKWAARGSSWMHDAISPLD